MTPQPARRDDLAAIRELLTRSELPSADLGERQLDHFLVARDGAGLAGVIGLEPYGADGLLRSAAVRPALRGQGLGAVLARSLEAHARAAGIEVLYLLTLTAERFFHKLGYAPIAREQAPAALRQSGEFRTLCPASAVCMTRRLV